MPVILCSLCFCCRNWDKTKLGQIKLCKQQQKHITNGKWDRILQFSRQTRRSRQQKANEKGSKCRFFYLFSKCKRNEGTTKTIVKSKDFTNGTIKTKKENKYYSIFYLQRLLRQQKNPSAQKTHTQTVNVRGTVHSMHCKLVSVSVFFSRYLSFQNRFW